MMSHQQQMQSVTREMAGQYYPRGNSQMHRIANMSSSSPGQGRQQDIAHEMMSDYDSPQSMEQRAMAAMYPQYFSQSGTPGTPSTVTSMVREPNDPATANMAMTPSLQGMLTPEQKKARDLNQALFGDRYQIGQPNTRFASCAITAGHHVAMTATIIKGNTSTSSSLLAQTGDGAMVAEQQNEKIEGSMQTDDEQDQAMIEKTIVSEVSTQTDDGQEQSTNEKNIAKLFLKRLCKLSMGRSKLTSKIPIIKCFNLMNRMGLR